MTPEPPPALRVQEALSAPDIARLRSLVAAARGVDGTSPLNEQAAFNLRTGAPGALHVLATVGDELAGYVYVGTADASGEVSAELVVEPSFRLRGLATALVLRAVEAAAPRSLRLWAHGNHAGAARLAACTGFSRVRDLWQMRRALGQPGPPLPEPEAAAGVTVAPFHPGRDEDAWLAVNARAFAAHPEQGSMTRSDLEARMSEPWFDPDGFFLAWRDDLLLGFHWTKVHRGDPGVDPDIGEVYVVGVDPAAQGLGLGRLLTLTGLHYLVRLGLPAVMLYVESDNANAIRVYERLGFAHVNTDVMYLRE